MAFHDALIFSAGGVHRYYMIKAQSTDIKDVPHGILIEYLWMLPD